MKYWDGKFKLLCKLFSLHGAIWVSNMTLYYNHGPMGQCPLTHYAGGDGRCPDPLLLLPAHPR